MDRRPRTPSRSRQARPAGPWKHGPIPVIGLIGGIGAGKSRVASGLEAHGAFAIDADAVGHALLEQRPVRDHVIARFGPGIVAEPSGPEASPVIDRRLLGALVFAEPAARHDLETIVHPRMRQTFERAIARTIRRGRARAVVLDAAVLLEAEWETLCDRVVFVDTPRDQRLARLAAQRGWTDEQLAARERAQWPLEKKRRAADVVLSNDGEPDALDAAVARFWSELLPPRASGPVDPSSRRKAAAHRPPDRGP